MARHIKPAKRACRSLACLGLVAIVCAACDREQPSSPAANEPTTTVPVAQPDGTAATSVDAAGARVAIDEVRRIEGTVVLEAVRPFVEQIAIPLRRCYEPWLERVVTVAVQWSIQVDGRAVGLSLDSPDGPRPEARACMAEVISQQLYVRVGVEGGPSRIEVRLTMTPPTGSR